MAENSPTITVDGEKFTKSDDHYWLMPDGNGGLRIIGRPSSEGFSAELVHRYRLHEELVTCLEEAVRYERQGDELPHHWFPTATKILAKAKGEA